MHRPISPHYVDVSKDTPFPDCRSPRVLERAGVMLHGSAGTNSLGWLQRREPHQEKRSSADFLVDREGTIYQIGVPGWYTYHAGNCQWRDRRLAAREANQLFVGVEIENVEDGTTPITDIQYIAVAALIRNLLWNHRLPVPNVVTHAALAIPRGRKSDPKTLSWPILSRELIHPSKEAFLIEFPKVMP